MHRRKLITLIGGAVIGRAAVRPRAALAQTAKVYRVGTLTPGLPIVAKAGPGAILFDALAKRGYVLGTKSCPREPRRRSARSIWCRR